MKEILLFFHRELHILIKKVIKHTEKVIKNKIIIK